MSVAYEKELAIVAQENHSNARTDPHAPNREYARYPQIEGLSRTISLVLFSINGARQESTEILI
jgi:hypothetical protein